MCWNAEVSITTYIFSLFASVFALYNNVLTIWEFLFYQSFISMQLLEYLIWTKTLSNRLLSQIGLLLILSQPLFSILRLKDNKEYKNLIIPLILFYSIFIIYTLYFWTNIDFKSIKASNGHLSWRWLTPTITEILYWFAFFIISFILKKDWLATLFLSITAMVTFIFYNKTLTFGSMWCWIANLASFYLIILVFYKVMFNAKCIS